MRVGVKAIGKQPNFEAIGKELVKTIDAVVAPKMAQYVKIVTGNWEHEPDSRTTKKTTKNAIILWSRPVGENTKFWIWTSFGTERHDIYPVNAAVLAFSTTYKPKTAPGPKVGGPGISSGPTRFAMYVDHPGTTPRHFEPAWAKWIKTWVYKDLNQGIKRGVNQVWK